MSRILGKYDIPIKVDLPGVGENLQDQPNNNLLYQFDSTFEGALGYVTFGSITDFFGPMPAANLSDWASQISTANNEAIPASTIEKLLQIQYDLLSAGVTDGETLLDSTVQIGLGPTNIVANAFWFLMPFSRGTIHITSADPSVYPAINPNYFLIDFDLTAQAAIAKWSRKFWSTEHVVSQAVEISPGFDAVPEDASDEVWVDWVKETCKLTTYILFPLANDRSLFEHASSRNSINDVEGPRRGCR